MPESTYEAISTVTLTTDTQYVTVANIPQNYQDLVIVIDGTNTSSTYIRANFGGTSFGSGQKFSYNEIYNGISSPYTPGFFGGTGGFTGIAGMGTRSQIFLHVLNYSSSQSNISYFWETRQGRPPASGYWGIAGGTWQNMVGGTSVAGGFSALTFWGDSGNIAAGTTISIYGLGANGLKALGGNIIQTDGNYWYHAFTSSGTFQPQTSLTCDVMVVAGGGSGGWPYSGGGGGGGLAYYASQALTAQSYAVAIGAGAAGGYNSGNGQQGSNSQFGSLTAAVGGGGGVGDSTVTTARNGGSGGGGAAISRNAAGNAGGTGTAGQGFAGGTGSPTPYTNESGGGGGGSGAAGSNATTLDAGAGGAGTGAYTTWLLATGTGINGYIAGGGGGGTNGGSASTGAGGVGGGGRGASNDGYQQSEPGARNTGGGSGGGAAGGAQQSPKSGGSGLVIVRYAV